MDATLRYESNNGAVIRFAPDERYHYTGTTLHDYKRDYTASRSKIVAFPSTVQEFTLDVVISGGTAKTRDEMTEAFEYDVRIGKAGKLWSNGYYLPCYCVGSEKDGWWWHDGYMHATLTFAAESALWVREVPSTFTPETTTSTDGIDYPHDWTFDYAPSVTINIVENDSFIPEPFKLTVSGAVAEGIEITIGGNKYALDIQLEADEYAVIDSINKKITKTNSTGETTNIFSSRVGEQVEGSGWYIFQPVPVGTSAVTWNGNYNFELVLYDRRAEPRWA